VAGPRQVALLMTLAALACGDGARPGGPAAGLAEATERGVAYLERESTDAPRALALGYFLHRRFRLEAFDDAPARYDAILSAAEPSQPAKRRTMPKVGALRIFRRLLVAANAFDAADLVDAEGTLDLTTARALYCDREAPPPDYPDLIRAEAAAGGYQLTHAVLALAWFRDNGCDPPVAADETAAWVDGLAALVRDHPVHELGFEAAALLAYLGAADRLPPRYVEGVISVQDADGRRHPCPAPPCDPPTGLRPERAASHWHSTALALWLLLETSTDAPADRFVPSATPLT